MMADEIHVNMMATKPKKRKCVVTESILNDFPFLQPGVNESYAFCSLCKTSFTIASGGRNSVKEHAASKRHKRASGALPGGSESSTLFQKFPPDRSEFSLALQEGTYAFHTIKHNQSFRSMDCSSGLIKKFYQSKFSCSRTKCEVIITNVIAKWATDLVLEDIQKASSITLLIDASNHGHVKRFPLLFRYAHVDSQSQCDCKVQINTKLVDFFEIEGDITGSLSQRILQIIKALNIEEKIVGVSSDNTNCNFSSLITKSNDNVINEIRESLQINVIALGCVPQIVHNCAHSSLGMIPLDIQGMITKIFGFFHVFNIRIDSLKDFCNYVGQQWKEIPNYNVRWFSLLPGLGRLLEHYSALKSFFLAEEKCPVVLKEWFSDPCTYLWLEFANSSLSVFHDTIKKVEAHEGTAVESSMFLRDFLQKITARRDDNFIPPKVKTILTSLEQQGSYTMACFYKVSKDFYTTAIQYLNARAIYFDEVDKLECILLKKIPERESFEKVVEFFLSKPNLIDIKEDDFFDEITCLKGFVTKEKLQEWNSNGINTCERWSQVFSYFYQNTMSFPQLKKIVELTLSMPGNNAPVEKVFSAMNMMWTSNRSRLSVQSIRSMLMVLINFPMSCQEFAMELANRKDILHKIQSSEKYVTFSLI